MQFQDKVKIIVESGKWWDGCVSGRREAGVPYGGPSGGNGGHGGAVILESSKDINTLLAFKYRKKFTAKAGEPWRSKEQYGANAKDLVLKVPVGTMITDIKTGQILFYFDRDKERFAVAHGWTWGLGNIEFKSSTLQYPSFATLWEPGGIKELELELQLMGDVALIGSPSVGKSTIINSLANTKAKVAEYHFTTLIPHLWSVKVGDFAFNIVDIPGLIAWASKGKWLGNEFLRHILKAKIFCLVMDLYQYDKGIEEGIALIRELLDFIKNKLHKERAIEFNFHKEWPYIVLDVSEKKEILFQKQISFVFNKFDLIQDEELMQEYIDDFWSQLQKFSFEWEKLFNHLEEKQIQKNIFVISAATHKHLEELAKFRADHLEHWKLIEYVPQKTMNEKVQVYEDGNKWVLQDISKEEKESLLGKWYLDENEISHVKVRYIDNKEIAKLVYTTQWGNDEAEMWFWSTLDQKGYLELIQKAWAQKGDIFKIKSHYDGYEDRYIQW